MSNSASILNIPDDWALKKLGAFCKFSQGEQITYEDQVQLKKQGYIRYLYIRDFFTDKFLCYVEDKYPNKIIEKHEIMMVNTGNTAGTVYKGKRGVLCNNAFKISFDTQNIDSDFLFSVLKSDYVDNQMQKLFNHAGQPHVGHKNIAQFDIAIPPLTEQKKVAEILTSVDKVIELTEIEIEKLKNLKKGMMQDLLTKGIEHTKFKDSPIGKIPESWEVKSLSEMGAVVKGLTYSPDDVCDKGLLVLRSSNVQDGRLSFKDNVYVNVDVRDDFLSREGDILICVRNGSKALIGKSASIPKSTSKSTHGAFMTVFRGERNHFVKFLIQSDLFFHQVGLDIGATINSINTGNLKRYKFAVPPKEEQDEISRHLEAIDRNIDTLNSKLNKIKDMKKGLMQDLLTGKVRVKV